MRKEIEEIPEELKNFLLLIFIYSSLSLDKNTYDRVIAKSIDRIIREKLIHLDEITILLSKTIALIKKLEKKE